MFFKIITSIVFFMIMDFVYIANSQEVSQQVSGSWIYLYVNFAVHTYGSYLFMFKYSGNIILSLITAEFLKTNIQDTVIAFCLYCWSDYRRPEAQIVLTADGGNELHISLDGICVKINTDCGNNKINVPAGALENKLGIKHCIFCYLPLFHSLAIVCLIKFYKNTDRLPNSRRRVFKWFIDGFLRNFLTGFPRNSWQVINNTSKWLQSDYNSSGLVSVSRFNLNHMSEKFC